MMRRGWMGVGVAVVAFLMALPALAVDPLHGVYKGSFTEGWQDYGIWVEVVVAGEKDEVRSYRVVFYLSDADGTTQRVNVDGFSAAGTPEGGLELALEGAAAGTYTLAATFGEGTFAGAFSNADQTASFALTREVKTPPTRGQAPPEGAIVLLDGTHLDHWIRTPEKWCLDGEGAMEVCSSSLQTTQEFGDGQYHIEFRTPLMANARGQARGNSGVYVMGRYEIQVLDSFGEMPAWDYCGGIYKVAAPRLNASLPPGEWQTYDITLRAPRFNEAGEKTENARITVLHNGELIHDDLELPDVTPGGVSGQEAAAGALMLQDHGNPVKYRNIWFKPLD